MHDPTDTHRRARLRGREAVARWRIESASWVGWLYVVNAITAVLIGIAGHTPRSLLVSAGVLAVASAMIYGIHRMRQGSRLAACSVVGAALLMSLVRGLGGGINVLDAIVLALLANGAWGVFQLAGVRRDAEHVPPAPMKAAARSH